MSFFTHIMPNWLPATALSITLTCCWKNNNKTIFEKKNCLYANSSDIPNYECCAQRELKPKCQPTKKKFRRWHQHSIRWMLILHLSRSSIVCQFSTIVHSFQLKCQTFQWLFNIYAPRTHAERSHIFTNEWVSKIWLCIYIRHIVHKKFSDSHDENTFTEVKQSQWEYGYL